MQRRSLAARARVYLSANVNARAESLSPDYLRKTRALAIVDSNLNTMPLAGLAWLSGDTNLDGTVTGDDYTIIDSNLGLGVGNPLQSAAIATPEPAAAIMAVAAALFAGPRRRRVR